MKLPNNSDIEILRYSDSAYDRLTAEISYLGEPIAQVNQDKGKDALELELFTEYGMPDYVLKFRLEDFLEALSIAKRMLEE